MIDPVEEEKRRRHLQQMHLDAANKTAENEESEKLGNLQGKKAKKITETNNPISTMFYQIMHKLFSPDKK